jgi:hypothetical protein
VSDAWMKQVADIKYFILKAFLMVRHSLIRQCCGEKSCICSEASGRVLPGITV